MKEAVRSVECEVWSVKFEVWSAKSAVCSVRCGVSREGHGRDRLSLNYRSFMFGKLPPPACPGLCYDIIWACLMLSEYKIYKIYKIISPTSGSSSLPIFKWPT